MGGAAQLLHQIFERQAARSPNATALRCGQACLSYGQLEQQANQLAHFLREQGAGAGTTVGLLLPRAPELYIALLAVLKAGAAYVPLEPDYPAERIGFILADSGSKLLLTSGALRRKAAAFGGGTILLDDSCDKLASYPGAKCKTDVTPGDLCYIIYTSGTTGRPKGVQIEHRSARHLVEAERDLFGVNPGDRVFQGFSIGFDASVEEIWLAFASGATLVVGTEQMVRAGPDLGRVLEELGVTVLSCVPTLLSMVEGDVPGLRLLILGGEVCPIELVKRWWKPHRRVVNTYGPTEATVVATWTDCQPNRRSQSDARCPAALPWF